MYFCTDIKSLAEKQSKNFVVSQRYQKNPHSTGRLDLITTLRDTPKKYNHRVALLGMEGVGKTQIAVEYVMSHRANYNAIFSINAEDLANLLQEIARDIKCINSAGSNKEAVAKAGLRQNSRFKQRIEHPHTFWTMKKLLHVYRNMG